MDDKPLKIKRKADDGYRLISVRVRADTLAALDKLADESNHSRNELINIILNHGIQNIEIE